LPAIMEQNRRTASDFWSEFENNHAVMLGALLDAVSSALRNLPNVRLPSKPRMANAAEWVTAAEAALGWEAGTHISDLQSNRRDANEASLDCEPVAMAIVELDLPWIGTPTQLHKKLSDNVSGIPKTVNGFGAALTRIQPVLLQVGIIIEKKRGKERSVTIKRIH
ncbi:MAG: ATP-binding protein, partial [Pseudomonadota bacterium]